MTQPMVAIDWGWLSYVFLVFDGIAQL